MAVILPNSVFIHIPKTGGTWVGEMLKKQGLFLEELLAKKTEPNFLLHSAHNVPLRNKEFQTRPHRFCFVRNPLSWYRSYWIFHNSIRWNNDTCISRLNDKFFEKYIKNIVEYCSKNKTSFLFDLYFMFTKYCTFIGKQETLRADIITALTQANESFREKIIRDQVSVNIYHSKEIAKSAVYTKAMQEDIISADSKCFEFYGYDKKIITDFRKSYETGDYLIPERLYGVEVPKGFKK
jgi:hypothetical protein